MWLDRETELSRIERLIETASFLVEYHHRNAMYNLNKCRIERKPIHSFYSLVDSLRELYRHIQRAVLERGRESLTGERRVPEYVECGFLSS